MIALYRYLLSGVVLSQRYLPPVLVFLGLLSVGTGSDSGPLLRTHSFCVAAVLVTATWLTVAVVNSEHPVQRQVTSATAGGSCRVLAAAIGVALTGCLLLIATGLGFPILSGHHEVTPGAVVAGAVAEFAAALVGISLGLFTSRLVISRLGVAVVVAVAVLLLLLLVRWASPVNPLIRLLASEESVADVTGTVVPLIRLTGISAMIFALSAVIVQGVAARRE